MAVVLAAGTARGPASFSGVCLYLGREARTRWGTRVTWRSQMHFCFVSTRRGSHFMTELLSAISAATATAGHLVELVFDKFPPLRGECIYVVIPHEFHAWGDPGGLPDARQCARTIALCTENPGTEWFEATYQLLPQFAAAVSINRSSAAELQRRGIRCEHLQLGYAPLWDTWHRDDSVERPVDVLYLGAADPRRDPLLAAIGGDLWARECQLLIPPLEPRTRPRPDFLKGTQKYHRLRSTQILLNLHRTTSSALEWMRFLEAICNGCVVVSEPCLDGDPLVPGEHFMAVTVDRIGLAVGRLLDEPDRLQLMRERAYDFVREELSMEPAGKRLAELAAELPREPPGTKASPSPAAAQTLPPSPRRSQTEAPLEEAAPPDEAQPPREAQPGAEAQPVSAPQNGSSLGAREPRRLLRSISNRMLRGGDRVKVLDETPPYARNKPRVSVVVVALPDREREAVDALASVAASLYGELEVLITGQSLCDRAVAALKSFLGDHPSLPAALLRQPVSHGAGHSLNVLAERARGQYLFVLNATGGIYPSTLQRLVTALDADPKATFSFPMVAVFDGDRPVELLSSLPWEPERLKSGNWIDAMALIRRKRLLELGCYTTDARLAGWEDFDLWCKCAEAGGHGVHVAQVLAWHRRAADPLAASRENGTPQKWALMRERFPRLLAFPSGG
jgi:Glycosyl transferase family 2